MNSYLLHVAICIVIRWKLKQSKVQECYIPTIFNVLIDDSSYTHGEESIVPTAHEHDCKTQHHS